VNVVYYRPSFGQAEEATVAQVIAGGHINNGRLAREFESAFAAMHSRKRAFALNSGTLALEVAMRVAGVRPGDAVVIPCYICGCVPQAIVNVGATPLATDIDAYHLGMSVESCRRVCECSNNRGQRVGAILAVHPFGFALDVSEFMALGYPVIEDCAASLGASIHGHVIGGLGLAAVFSFNSMKVMTAGAGGMLLLDDDQLSGKVEETLDYGLESSGSQADRWRVNGSMSDLNASLGLVQLRRLPEFIDRRSAIARRYAAAFADVRNVRLPVPLPGHAPSWYRYILRTRNAADVVRSLGDSGIQARPKVADLFEDWFGTASEDYHVARSVRDTFVSLPIYPALSDQEVGLVIASVLRVMGS
jgi:dTDP-4-amino-4,6-dideoxygalactose transaminase